MSDNTLPPAGLQNTNPFATELFGDMAKILVQRRTPAPPDDLSTRIIRNALAQTRPARKELSGLWTEFQAFWEELGSMLFLPKPAIAFASLLVLGIAISFWTRHVDSIAQTVLPNMTPYDLASFMIIEDRFVAGEWL